MSDYKKISNILNGQNESTDGLPADTGCLTPCVDHRKTFIYLIFFKSVFGKLYLSQIVIIKEFFFYYTRKFNKFKFCLFGSL